MANSQHINGDLSVGRNVAVGGKTTIQGNAEVGHNLKVKGWLEAPNIKDINKGVFTSLAALNAAYPNPKNGWVAGVLTSVTVNEGEENGETTYYIQLYAAVGGAWEAQEYHTMEFKYDFEQPLEELYHKLVDNAIGGITCTTAGNEAIKEVVTELGGAGLIDWATFKVCFENANTSTGTVTLSVTNESGTSYSKHALYYNGVAVSDENTWEAGEVCDVTYNPGDEEHDIDPSFNAVPIREDSIIDTEHLKDAAVTTAKIADENVTWEKLDENTKQLIYAPGGVRIPLAQEFGNDEHIGISQKVLTESRNDLQSQIDAITTTVELAVTPTAVFIGETTSVTLNATSSRNATTINIEKDGENMPEEASDTDRLVVTDSLSPETEGTTRYKAKFVINGYNKETTEKTVTAVNPIYYGSGSGIDNFWTNKVQFNTPTTSPYRTYDVTIRANGDYVYFAVPNSMTIHSATLSGFDFPLDSTVDTSKPGYKIYKSANTYVPDTLSIVII